jgi:hypothetical protein
MEQDYNPTLVVGVVQEFNNFTQDEKFETFARLLADGKDTL